ncbi:hypothetical protein ACTFIR_005912 [Dictyostelium discoideum]
MEFYNIRILKFNQFKDIPSNLFFGGTIDIFKDSPYLKQLQMDGGKNKASYSLSKIIQAYKIDPNEYGMLHSTNNDVLMLISSLLQSKQNKLHEQFCDCATKCAQKRCPCKNAGLLCGNSCHKSHGIDSCHNNHMIVG